MLTIKKALTLVGAWGNDDLSDVGRYFITRIKPIPAAGTLTKARVSWSSTTAVQFKVITGTYNTGTGIFVTSTATPYITKAATGGRAEYDLVALGASIPVAAGDVIGIFVPSDMVIWGYSTVGGGALGTSSLGPIAGANRGATAGSTAYNIQGEVS